MVVARRHKQIGNRNQLSAEIHTAAQVEPIGARTDLKGNVTGLFHAQALHPDLPAVTNQA